MRVRVGTSGFAYKEWKGSFYPEEIPADAMLRFYAEHFATVEINNTFYRMPSESLLARWGAEVPTGFTFVLKAPLRITHIKRIGDVREDVQYLLGVAAVLGERLGPLLFQLPPSMKKDVTRLRDFLATVPAGYRPALEFRHPSWQDEEVHAALRERGAALCVADTDEEPAAAIIPTSRWGYLRLRRITYDDAALASWANRIREQPWDEAFVFFKHEDAGVGPRLASRLLALLEAGSPA